VSEELLLPIGNEGWQICETHESRILKHCIARLRLGQLQPIYRIGDVQFDYVVQRMRLPIARATMPDGTVVPHLAYEVGTTTISIVAGGPLMSEVQIDLVEGRVAREPSPWECPVCRIEIVGIRFWRAVGQRLVCAQCVRKAIV
jgi:hypothetical protein